MIVSCRKESLRIERHISSSVRSLCDPVDPVIALFGQFRTGRPANGDKCPILCISSVHPSLHILWRSCYVKDHKISFIRAMAAAVGGFGFGFGFGWLQPQPLSMQMRGGMCWCKLMCSMTGSAIECWIVVWYHTMRYHTILYNIYC
jgi:hypothetical protein